MGDELTKTDLFKSLGLMLTIVALIVGATVYVANRPSRDEVQKMIQTTVSTRLDKIEMEISKMNDYLLEHGVPNNQGARK